jgi:tyrosine aminotransferase
MRYSVHGSLQEVKMGAHRLAQVILGASHLVQTVVPTLLQPKTAETAKTIAVWKQDLRQTLYKQATCLCAALNTMPGLRVMAQPAGSMYAMIRIDMDAFDTTAISNDIEFTQRLFQEENVFVLPGSCFSKQDQQGTGSSSGGCGVDDDFVERKKEYFFRVVFCAPVTVLQEATARIRNFCARHVVRKNQ